MIPFNLPGDQELHQSFPYTLRIHKLSDHVPPHTHNFLEYTYAVHGSGTEIINGQERQICAGTFTLLLPHQVHEIRIDKGQELQLYVGAIGLKALFASQETGSLQSLLMRAGTEGEPSYQLEPELAGQLLRLLEEMYGEINSSQSWSQLLFLCKLTEAFVLLDRHCFTRGHEQTAPASVTGKGSMADIILYVYQNFREDIKLELLADRFHLSVPHISSSFKAYIGEHFHRYLEGIRISHACGLLISGDEPVTSICYEVGFTSYATFSRVFQARIHMSPTSFRKLNRIDTSLLPAALF
ncbi:AraC family transcriptional regulator [Paenibacillus sp. MMS20-IR301]|uniref:AraC family transcriptional regulator n=1 Tax=Paenibacillus sp. MMS20-IR301 TaxID=2895946 RepID=UPI0028E4A8D9|nr:AraC family transcriptional regulator [Paenibacillus sp. MMS20-IR301]WNS45150.1 AraC family transcriptional regulator [Paenibacillus sp. MMS20-IR301]